MSRKGSNMRIIWEKWYPPGQPKKEDDGWEGLSEYEQIESEGGHLAIGQILPFGDVPFSKPFSEEDFNLWLGHSDFTITPKFLMEISEFPGVESVDPISRYRFRIGVGKLFTASDVLGGLAREVLERKSGEL